MQLDARMMMCVVARVSLLLQGECYIVYMQLQG